MENMNNILDRKKITEEIQNILRNFDENCKNIHFKKGIYIYGATGCGKTVFVTNLLKELDYDVIKYDAGDVRNKSLIDTITSNSISNRNVLHMMQRKVKKIAIVMDEIDGMNNGDKGGITSLIKLIRQKKTKKQKSEDVTLNPIICIGNYFMDKKIKELMKICNVFELKTPSESQIIQLLRTIPSMEVYANISEEFLVHYIQGDLRKFMFIKKIYEKDPKILQSFAKMLKMKTNIEDSKKITKELMKRQLPINEHNTFMNETDRTIVALLWHENIIDVIEKQPIDKSFVFYSKDHTLFIIYFKHLKLLFQCQESF
jgi:DNA polymerase III delta prime subunit